MRNIFEIIEDPNISEEDKHEEIERVADALFEGVYDAAERAGCNGPGPGAVGDAIDIAEAALNEFYDKAGAAFRYLHQMQNQSPVDSGPSLFSEQVE